MANLGVREARGPGYFEDADGAPTLDAARETVKSQLGESDDLDLVSAVAWNAMMLKYAAGQMSSAISGLVTAVESLRDAVEGGKDG